MKQFEIEQEVVTIIGHLKALNKSWLSYSSKFDNIDKFKLESQALSNIDAKMNDLVESFAKFFKVKAIHYLYEDDCLEELHVLKNK